MQLHVTPRRHRAITLDVLRQIFLFLFAVCLTVPAVAMPLCHQAAQSGAVAVMHDGMDHSVPAAAPVDPHRDAPQGGQYRDCIGCAAPASVLHIAPHQTLAPIAATTLRIRALVAVPSAPDLPPPRA